MERVRSRIEEGGHAVPEAKVRERYERCGALIRQAMLLCDQGHVFDNSRLNTPPERIIGFTAGRVTYVRPIVPAWVPPIYRQDLML